MIAFRFTSLRTGDARYDIEAASLSHLAAATKGEDATKIGIGASAGAIIRGIVSGKDGAAKGAAMGGGAGTGVVLATKGQEVRLGPGTDVTTRLSTRDGARQQELNLTRSSTTRLTEWQRPSVPRAGRSERRLSRHFAWASIVIAHRLATIVRADAIFVVKDSQLAERGSHDELLAASGFYSGLYNIQFGEPALAYLAARLS